MRPASIAAWILLALNGLGPLSCRHSREADILTPAEFADVYVAALLTAQDTTRLNSTALDSAAVWTQVLRAKGIPEATYRRTLDYFDRHPQLWHLAFQAVADSLQGIERRRKTAPSDLPANNF